jgi:hypothetical protein
VSTRSPVASTRAVQDDEGVREIVAAELARIESDLDRGEGRRRQRDDQQQARAPHRPVSAQGGRFHRTGRTAAPWPAGDGFEAPAANHPGGFERAENHNGGGEQEPPKTIHHATGKVLGLELGRLRIEAPSGAIKMAARPLARLKSYRARPICCPSPRLDRA